MSNFRPTAPFKVVPYCQDPMSSCGLFAYGNMGEPKAGTVFQPMFFSGKSADSSSTHKPKCPDGFEADYSGVVASCKKKKIASIFSGYGIDSQNPFGDSKVNLNLPDAPSSSSENNWSDKIDADTISSALETGQTLLGLFKKGELSEVESVCGKQPKFLASKAKKQAWANCASAYVQSKINASSKGKSSGLSTVDWIGIGIGSAVVIGGIIYFISTKNQQKVVMKQVIAR